VALGRLSAQLAWLRFFYDGLPGQAVATISSRPVASWCLQVSPPLALISGFSLLAAVSSPIARAAVSSPIARQIVACGEPAVFSQVLSCSAAA
jgi:hypothetical protein